MTFRSRVQELWQNMPATPYGMMKIDDNASFEEADRSEMIQLVRPFVYGNVVELAAGIGRFTGELASRAAHVTCIEWMPQFLEINRRSHQHRGNVEFVLGDVRDAEFPENSVDFLCAGWLLAYLEDGEAAQLVAKASNWISAEGKAVFRETCAPKLIEPTRSNPTYYRARSYYEELLGNHFHILHKGSFASWLEFRDYAFSCYWVVEKL